MLRLIFALPPVVLFALGLVVMVATYHLQTMMKAEHAAREATIDAPPPEAVALDSFDPDTIGKSREVHVLAQINPAWNARLGNGTTAALAIYLVGPSATAEDNTALAAIIIPEERRAALEAFLISSATGEVGPLGPVYALNGFERYSGKATLSDRALYMRQIKQSPDLFYIAPFFEGRAASLKVVEVKDSASSIFLVGYLIGAGLLVIAFLRSKNRAAGKPRKPGRMDADADAVLLRLAERAHQK